MQINFGKETRDALAREGYLIADIAWVGSLQIEIPIDQFFEVADNTMYNCGYGSAQMPMDIIIVMHDGSFFERAEYDGSEWWRYMPVVKRPLLKSTLKFKNFDRIDYDPILSQYCVKPVKED